MRGAGSRDYSRDLQEKLEIYLIGLVFTLLAAAVQTAKFGGSSFADACELVSWLCLLTSGLAGMWRLEWLPVAHLAHGAQQDAEERIEQLEQQAARGVRMTTFAGREATVDGVLVALRSSVSLRETEKGDITAWSLRRYRAHKWMFVAGLVFLLVARGYLPGRGVILTATALAPAASASAPHTGASGAAAAPSASSR